MFVLLFFTIFCNVLSSHWPTKIESSYSDNKLFKVTVQAEGDLIPYYWTDSYSSILILDKKNNNNWQNIYKIKINTDGTFRPKFIFVNNDGRVITLDDWTNTPSLKAFVLYDISGAVICNYSLDYLINEIIGVNNFKLSERTVRGRKSWWIDREPFLKSKFFVPVVSGLVIFNTKKNYCEAVFTKK